MALTLSALGNPEGSSFTTELNSNFEAIAEEFARVLMRDGSISWLGNMNANAKRLYNLPEPIYAHEPLRVADIPLFTKGDKGDPGANVSAIGLFNAAGGLSIPVGVDAVKTSGYSVNGVGSADYSYDATVDAAYVAANPRTSFLTSNGRGFKLADTYVHVRKFGARGNGVVDDTDAIQAALDWAAANGKATVHSHGGTYLISAGLDNDGSGVTFDATGATFVDNTVASTYMIKLGGDESHLIGGTWRLTGGSVPWHLEVTGTNCSSFRALFEKVPEGGGYHVYIRTAATGFAMVQCKLRGGNGIGLFASDASFIANDLKGRAIGGDDAIALKSIDAWTKGVVIAANRFESLAFGVSIGSEVGVLGANDPTYSRGVSQVVFADNTLVNCSGIGYIKPGTVEVYDYRDGTVEHVTFSNNVLVDLTGHKFYSGFALYAARGARIRHITGTGNKIFARCRVAEVSRKIGCLDCFNIDYSAVNPGILEPSISDIHIEVDYVDPYEGQTNHASRPGDPVANIAACENQTTAHGTMSNVYLDVGGNGCQANGIVIGAGLDDAVTIQRANLTNTGRDGSTSYAGIHFSSRIEVKDANITTYSSTQFPYIAGANGEIVSNVHQALLSEALPADAGVPKTVYPWAAPRRCFLHRIDIISPITQAQNDTNYLRFGFRNQGGTTNEFFSADTKTSGGNSLYVNMTLNAGQIEKIMELKNIGATFDERLTKTELKFDRDDVLSVGKTDTGSGVALTGAVLRLHYAPY